jgi:hypothetical protein
MPQIKYKFNPFKETGVDVPKDRREEAAQAVAEYVLEQIHSYSADGKTSVAGGLWKRKLSKGYLKEKEHESSANFANLELTGELMDSLEADANSRGDVTVSVPSDQAGKAEGNLIGSYGREEDPKKARQFMPYKDGQRFRREILSGIKDILQEFTDEEN